MTWVYPTADPVVTSPFSTARKHPVLGVVKAHTGTDFRAREGTELRAATAGVVVRSTYDAATAGNYVRIDVGGGVWIGYSHLSRRDVKVGDHVTTGEVIGLAGNTGSATAAHLHFEVCVDSVKVDAAPYLAARTAGTASTPGGSSGTESPTPADPPTIPEHEEDDDMSKPWFYRSKAGGIMIVNSEGPKPVTAEAWAVFNNLGWAVFGPGLDAMDPGPFDVLTSMLSGPHLDPADVAARTAALLTTPTAAQIAAAVLGALPAGVAAPTAAQIADELGKRLAVAGTAG